LLFYDGCRVTLTARYFGPCISPLTGGRPNGVWLHLLKDHAPTLASDVPRISLWGINLDKF